MAIIKIGSIDLKHITEAEVMAIVKIEKIHLVFEYNEEKIWGQPEVVDFSKDLFSDTVVIDYKQKRISDGMEGRVCVFFLNYKDFSFHWHFKDSDKTEKSSRLRIESIRYLIKMGYDVPLY